MPHHRAFKVSINGNHLCTAAVGPDGVLSVILSWVTGGRRATAGDLHLHVGGLDSSKNEHIGWSVPTPQIGDVIRIEVVRTDTADPPATHHPGRETYWEMRRRLFFSDAKASLSRAGSNLPKALRDVLDRFLDRT